MTSQTEAVKLEPCPFCGERELLKLEKWEALDRRLHFYTVQCRRCGAEGPAQEQDESPEAAWNRRSNPAYDSAVQRAERAEGQLAEREEFDRQHSMHVLVPPERYEQLAAATSREAALREALRELLDAELTPMPDYEAGIVAQNDWADRRARARNNAQALAGKGEKA